MTSKTLQGDPPKLEHAAPGWLKKYFESLTGWMKATQPIPGSGITISETPTGRMLSAKGGGAAEEEIVPFDVFDAVDPNAPGSSSVRVRMGTINGIIPLGMFPGDTPPFFINNVGDDDIIVAKVHVDFDETFNLWTMGEIEVVKIAGGEIPEPSLGFAYLFLGSVDVTEGVKAVESQKAGLRNWFRCGNDESFYDQFPA